MTRSEDPSRVLPVLPARTLAARVRRLMPEIVQQIDEGVSYEVVVAALADVGLGISVSTFRKYLYRYRQDRRREPSEAPSEAAVAAGTSCPTTVPPPDAAPAASINPPSFADAMDLQKREERLDRIMKAHQPRLGLKTAR